MVTFSNASHTRAARALSQQCRRAWGQVTEQQHPCSWGSLAKLIAAKRLHFASVQQEKGGRVKLAPA